jgi:hypothetical protein
MSPVEMNEHLARAGSKRGMVGRVAHREIRCAADDLQQVATGFRRIAPDFYPERVFK